MFPLSHKFQATSYLNAFILNAFATAMIAALAIAMSSELNDERSKAYEYFNNLFIGKDLTYTHKMTIVFTTSFIGAIIVFFLMYALLGFGGGMIVPIQISQRKKIKFLKNFK